MSRALPPIPPLEARLRKLAEDKANLQLILRLLDRLNPLPGIDQMLHDIVINIMDTIGGTNVKIYYWKLQELCFLDFFTTGKVIGEIDDPLVVQVASEHRFVEQLTDSTNALLKDSLVEGAFTWCFPLLVGQHLIGVVKIENLHIAAEPFREHLPVFFNHVAILLSNEIRNYSRERAELALKQTTEELNNYFNYSQDLFAIGDIKGNFRKLNPTWQKVLGYSPAELEGTQFLALVHPDDLAPTQQGFFQLLDRRPVLNFINRYRHRDGTWRWLEWLTIPNGNLLYATARDITERKKTEEELARWAHLFQHAGWGIATSSPDASRFVMVNPAFASSLGYSTEEIVQLPITELFPPQQRSEFASHVAAANQKGHHAFETIYRRKDGTTFPVWIAVTVVRNEKGDILYRVVNTQDITERKQVEAELERYRHHLEEQVDQRTLELAEARDTAQAANLAKTTFLANMSHELRTPLNVILGFTQLLHKDPSLSENARRSISIIDRSGEHLLGMINDILDLAKIEAGRTDLKEETFDILELGDEIIEMLRTRAEDKGLTLGLELVPGLIRHIRADLGKVRRILVNILGNAVKFTDHGQVTLLISTLPQPASGKVVLQVEVRDSGIGIPADRLDSIFNPFVQLQPGKGQQGTGLGLTISRSLASVMGGELRVRSAEGRGSAFTLTMPAVSVEPSETEDEPGSTRFFDYLEQDQGEIRVLVVEDDRDNAALLEEILMSVGFSVRVVENGLQGLEMASIWSPQFIWMDLRMPVMDGYESTRKIRKLPGGGEIKIVAVTTTVFKETEDAILKAGCDGIVHKPFRREQILHEMSVRLGVRFRHGKEQLQPKETKRVSVKPEEFMSLAPEIVEGIKHAAMELHGHGIVRLANELEAQRPQLALWLKQRALNYDFASIEALIAASKRG